MAIPDNIKEIFNKIKLEIKDEDDDQRFIKKDDLNNDITNNNEITEKIAKKNNIFPKNNQVRNLDIEVGGLEAKERKQTSSEDVWDDRSEEVDEMGSTNIFETTGMRSVVWKKKKKRLKKEKQQEDSFDSMSYTDRLKNLRQDRSGAFSSHKQNGGGGFIRF